MKRNQFIKSLGILVGGGMIFPEFKSERLALPATTSNADTSIGVQRMRISADGNISLGCTNPAAKLIVCGGDQI
jgi:hypothetical protein